MEWNMYYDSIFQNENLKNGKNLRGSRFFKITFGLDHFAWLYQAWSDWLHYSFWAWSPPLLRPRLMSAQSSTLTPPSVSNSKSSSAFAVGQLALPCSCYCHRTKSTWENSFERVCPRCSDAGNCLRMRLSSLFENGLRCSCTLFRPCMTIDYQTVPKEVEDHP